MITEEIRNIFRAWGMAPEEVRDTYHCWAYERRDNECLYTHPDNTLAVVEKEGAVELIEYRNNTGGLRLRLYYYPRSSKVRHWTQFLDGRLVKSCSLNELGEETMSYEYDDGVLVGQRCKDLFNPYAKTLRQVIARLIHEGAPTTLGDLRRGAPGERWRKTLKPYRGLGDENEEVVPMILDRWQWLAEAWDTGAVLCEN